MLLGNWPFMFVESFRRPRVWASISDSRGAAYRAGAAAAGRRNRWTNLARLAAAAGNGTW